jgi:hypothetical protein
MVHLQLVAVAVLSGAPLGDLESRMLFREIDGATQHLYSAKCGRGKTGGPVCSLKVMSVSSDKSALPCTVTYESLFEFEPAVSPQKDAFTVSISGGICHYTNTYVLSPAGMVQTKTSPPSVPDKLKGVCDAFPPKVYQAAAVPDADVFPDVPLGACKTMSVRIDNSAFR